MKNLSFYSSLLILIAVLHGCDSIGEPPSIISNLPELSDFSVVPSSVIFLKELDGYKDTTLTFNISVTPSTYSDTETVNFTYTVLEQRTREVLFNNSMTANGTSYVADFELETQTTTVLDLIVEVNAFTEDGERTYAQSYVNIDGFSNAAPVILFAENPETVSLPDQGSKVVSFKAKVTDEDGQNTIDGVFLRLISRASGEVSGSPFPLLDNGTQEDEFAADSIFTASFTISSNNDPQTYDILYYATDIGGLVSDTTQTTFRISSN